MTQPRQFRILPRLGLRGWLTVGLALATSLAILAAVAVVALGVLLFLLPVLAVATVLYYLFPSRFRTAHYQRGSQSTIIDGEFRVVDSAQLEKLPEERN